MPRFVSVCVLVVAILAGMLPNAFAVNPDEVLEDAALEARARALSVEIRCLVCQNQSIDDSDAQLARDLRVLVREKLVEGLSDQEVLDYLVARYGEFVLLKPRFNTGTATLWLAPFVILLLAGTSLVVFSRNKNVAVSQSAELSKDEQTNLDRLLKESNESKN